MTAANKGKGTIGGHILKNWCNSGAFYFRVPPTPFEVPLLQNSAEKCPCFLELSEILKDL